MTPDLELKEVQILPEARSLNICGVSGTTRLVAGPGDREFSKLTLVNGGSLVKCERAGMVSIVPVTICALTVKSEEAPKPQPVIKKRQEAPKPVKKAVAKKAPFASARPKFGSKTTKETDKN